MCNPKLSRVDILQTIRHLTELPRNKSMARSKYLNLKNGITLNPNFIPRKILSFL